MTACAIGKQIKLLLLDAILHLTARTIKSVVEILCFGFAVGHQVARIAPFGSVLSLDDDASATIPAASGIKRRMKATLFTPGAVETLLGRADKGLYLSVQGLLARDADETIDAVALTPVHSCTRDLTADRW
jgi:hypothetical protein